MRFVSVLVAFALCFNSPLAAAADAQNTISEANASNRSSLLADCNETVFTPSPMAPRGVLHRTTFASKPGRPPAGKRHKQAHKKPVAHKHKRIVQKKVEQKKVAQSKPVVHKKVTHKKPVAHKKRASRKHAPRRPVHRTAARALQRVTYASPLCEERTQGINDMLGLDSIPTETPVAATDILVPNEIFDLPPVLPGGTASPSFPGNPFFPGVPVIILPPLGPPGPGNPTNPGGPDTPPVITPPTSSVPEPASWAMMIFGMALIGRGIRRRRVVALRKCGCGAISL
ncbi:MAG TPA: PEPxxWA-CTERM sorting domain-containing protein [Sphingomonas sp.]|nr:PEPxxWA-CTERM sorting domain-containing protein [Sphingomonas sp.]